MYLSKHFINKENSKIFWYTHSLAVSVTSLPRLFRCLPPPNRATIYIFSSLSFAYTFLSVREEDTDITVQWMELLNISIPIVALHYKRIVSRMVEIKLLEELKE